MNLKKSICVIIPCYKVKKKILNVLKKIDYENVDKVIVVDDYCPENSGKIAEEFLNKKVEVVYCDSNLGVGGASIFGFKKAIKEGFDILFKIDGDGQHDPKYIVKFKDVFENEHINFCKGSRFLIPEEEKKIPKIRYIGNKILTYITKKICKIDNLTDAVNGYLAIKSELLKKIDLDQVSFDYFFEEDLLFKLSFHDIKIKEIPIETIYFENRSSLNPFLVILPFLIKHFKNFIFRLKYEFSRKK
tara:strand:+ start:1305 stop:2039 length:735 start_codon:yes stop_codon:yes gene_type:complete